MSIPANYTNAKVYLNDAVEFLKEFHWLFSYPNTHILVEEVLKHLQDGWMPYLNNLDNSELNELPFGYINNVWPTSLKNFISKIESLKPKADIVSNEEMSDLPKDFFRGLGVKKKHEILSLAPLIQKNFDNFDLIIDIGAGLGYLPQLLYEKHKYKILAIETDEKKIISAQKRQKELYPKSENFVKYVQHYVNEESSENINKFVGDFLKTDPKSTKICLIGLHACADLTITMIKLFFKMENIKNIIVMPCCYHRLQKIENFDNLQEKFINFPVSNCLKDIYENYNGAQFLKSTFLRLSCQSSASSWRKMSLDEHFKHSINILRRNILQIVAEKEGYQLSRLKRKCKTSDETISGYINELKTSHKLIKNNQNVPIDVIADQIECSWDQNKHFLNLFEVYVALQTSIQPICENIVLLDRVLFFEEFGVECAAIKVSNDELSPRCFALVARKPVS